MRQDFGWTRDKIVPTLWENATQLPLLCIVMRIKQVGPVRPLSFSPFFYLRGLT